MKPPPANDEHANGSATNVFALVQLRQRWRDLQRGRPGHRFEEWYERSRRTRRRLGALTRILLLLVALACLAIGLFLVIFPGPAIPFLMVSGGLLALESRPVARLMDWAEVHLRRIGRWAWQRWRRAPVAGRIALLATAGCVSATSMYLAYRLVQR